MVLISNLDRSELFTIVKVRRTEAAAVSVFESHIFENIFFFELRLEFIETGSCDLALTACVIKP